MRTGFATVIPHDLSASEADPILTVTVQVPLKRSVVRKCVALTEATKAILGDAYKNRTTAEYTIDDDATTIGTTIVAQLLAEAAVAQFGATVTSGAEYDEYSARLRTATKVIEQAGLGAALRNLPEALAEEVA